MVQSQMPIEYRLTTHLETRCAILRACMARAGAKSEFYRTWRAELQKLEAELTARDVNGCTCGDAYDSRIVDVPRCDYCTKGIVQRQAADYRLNAPPRF